MNNEIKILIVAGAMDKKFISKIAPIVDIDNVKKIYVASIRSITYHKVLSYHPNKLFRRNFIIAEIYRFFLICYILLKKDIQLIMGVYLIPHGILAGVFGKIFNKPVIQNVIGKDLPVSLKYRYIFKFISKADIVITRGEKSKQVLISKGIDEEKTYCIPNVFKFSHVPLIKKKTVYEYDLIFVGNIVKIKRIDIFLKALYIVKHHYRFAHFKAVLVGDGNLKQKMIDLARELRLPENVSFLGYQEDIYSLLNKSRIFMMTSEYEGFPMAMVEAMSCGLPCIMPDVSNIPTVAIHNYNALLVPVGDVEGFAKQIHELLTDNELYNRLSNNALKLRKEKEYEYSLENATNIWKEILRKGP